MRGGKEVAAVSSSKRRRSIRREIFFLSSMRRFFFPLASTLFFLGTTQCSTYRLSVCLSLPAAAHFHSPMPYGLSVSACSSSITITTTTRRRKCHQAHHPTLCNWCTYTLCPCLSSPNTQRCVRLPLYSLSLSLSLSWKQAGNRQAEGGEGVRRNRNGHYCR